jgi:hypothetical protein
MKAAYREDGEGTREGRKVCCSMMDAMSGGKKGRLRFEEKELGKVGSIDVAVGFGLA